tara:strand:+ start:134 stop:790 length:657 start_codon:yes stop_codon:yes gene_type:complete
MMNKIILTLFVCLLHFNVEAKNTYNYSNLLIQIPGNAIPLSQLTEQNYKEFNLNKDEFKKLINVYEKMKYDGTSEFIINKDIFYKTGEHIHIFKMNSANEILKSVNDKTYCDKSLLHLKLVNKDKEIKKKHKKVAENSGSNEVIQNFVCKTFPVDNLNFQYLTRNEHINLSNHNIGVTTIQVSKNGSKINHTLQLSSYQNHIEMNKILTEIISSLAVE